MSTADQTAAYDSARFRSKTGLVPRFFRFSDILRLPSCYSTPSFYIEKIFNCAISCKNNL